MADEPRDDAANEQPAEDQAADQEEQAAPEAEVSGEQPAEDQAAEPEDSAPGEETAEEPHAEEPAAEESPANEATADAPAGDEPKSPTPESGKGDLPPGADLDPITLEPKAELSAEERARLEAEEEERARRDAELAGSGEEPAATARAPARMESGARYHATGKRKRSIARVAITPGEGKIEVNSRSLEEYFPRPLHRSMALQPLSATGYEGNVDVRVRVHGGGVSGQAGAVRHGIARALTEIDAELRGDLKRRGYLTRDARVKERRKAGLKKARKRPQFSKR
jgi:small subunit ribosomal protein S9